MEYQEFDLHVGEEFPIPLPQTGQEGLYPMLADESIMLPVLMPDVSENEIKEFSGDMQVGVIVRQSVPFITLYYNQGWCFDGSLNPYNYDAEYREDFINGEGNAVTIPVVESTGKGRTRIVRHIRVVALKHEIMDCLRDAYQKCAEVYSDAIAVNRTVSDVYVQYPDAYEMARDADKAQWFLND